MDIKELNAAGSEAHHPWEYARFDVVYSLFTKYKQEEVSVIYDVGCGDTFFMERFHDKFPSASYHGIDIAFDDEYIASCEKRFGKKKITLYKNLDDAQLKKHTADSIFLLDVIEHIDNDKAFLKSLYQHPSVTDKTQIYIAVPAFQQLFVSRDTWLGHYRRYTLKGLKNTVNECGFRPVKGQYFFFLLLFPRIITRLKETVVKPDIHKIKGIGGYKKKPLFDLFFIGLLKIDFLISGLFNYFGLKLPGLSCFVLCKKQ